MILSWIIAILGYPVSYFLFKKVLELDRTHQFWKQEKDHASMWSDYYDGRRKIFTIILLIPFFNLGVSIIMIFVTWLYSYNIFEEDKKDIEAKSKYEIKHGKLKYTQMEKSKEPKSRFFKNIKIKL